jgi:hypothetical protein
MTKQEIPQDILVTWEIQMCGKSPASHTTTWGNSVIHHHPVRHCTHKVTDFRQLCHWHHSQRSNSVNCARIIKLWVHLIIWQFYIHYTVWRPSTHYNTSTTDVRPSSIEVKDVLDVLTPQAGKMYVFLSQLWLNVDICSATIPQIFVHNSTPFRYHSKIFIRQKE